MTLGFKLEGLTHVQQNIALFLGALLTVVNGWAAVFDYRKLWVRQKSTLLELYHLRNELSFKLSIDDTSDESAATLFEQYQEIWERDSNEWKNIIYKTQAAKQNVTDKNG